MPAAEHRPPGFCLLNEAAHLATSDVLDGVDVIVRTAEVAVCAVVVGALARSCPRVGHADGDRAVPARVAVRAGVGAEIRVERAVLLHDHDDVPDLVNADEPRRVRLRR